MYHFSQRREKYDNEKAYRGICVTELSHDPDCSQCRVILVEGGPQLLGDFFAERLLDELFLTLAPQIAGRDNATERPGLVTGQRFAPEHPLWGTLVSVKRGGSHLFLHYAFEAVEYR